MKFLADTVGNRIEAQGGGTVLTSSSGPTSRRAYISQSPQGSTLDAAALGVDTLHGAAGDDVLTAARAAAGWSAALAAIPITAGRAMMYS